MPEQAQGASLLPLLAAPDNPSAMGWNRRAVFTERKNPPFEETEGTPDAYAVIADGWKLIWNEVVRDDRPELELFDHVNDPLNLVAHKVAPALAAANTVVLKPAHATPLTAPRLARILEHAGLPT